MTHHRLNKLLSYLPEAGLDAVVLNPGPTLTYLTGLRFHTSERPTVLVVVPGQEPLMILPELEARKLEQSSIPMRSIFYGDNPSTWGAVFRKALEALTPGQKKIGLEPTRLRYLELNLLEKSLPSASFTSAEGPLSKLRMQKDEQEISHMRKAVTIAQDALLATLPFIRAGKTEMEVAGELAIQLIKAGSESELPFSPIISGGPNSANPHASPSSRELLPGDCLVIDWGASYMGYFSDLTRTFAIDHISPEMEKAGRLVEQANAAGRSASRAGIPAGDVDRAARKIIEEGGFGPFFTHRTGHGLGMEGHEHPYIYAENALVLQPGMTYTIEPGIYLPGRNGVRIEDNIVITETGAESLSSLPRQVKILK
jgi:Xaa-Pro dipeptidase